ncbi:YciI family protein [Helicobacter trogontum]|uniref:GTP cyclohydrolase n=1 Tax=Helicobacter trogontum TaxID=50960 RepID=A0A4U8TEB2_9HELI|nr:YciI family protein [Helicobacter trogontum]MDY5186026.1 YciI family protein [Helicobacter trogontum]TLD98365.1 GTP cyclohydrolase [Helicobacter trogontum]
MNKLFVCKVNYTKPFSQVEQFLAEHRAYLKLGYDSNVLLASGPRNPKDGGLIIGRFCDRDSVLDFAKKDPFCINNVAEYEIIEFDAVLYSKVLDDFFKA